MKKSIDSLFGLVAWSWLFRLIFGFGDAISPSGLPKLHLRHRDGRCRILFGSLPTWSLDGVAGLLREHGVSRAVIKLRKDGRFDFSRSVPEELKQRLRNLILNR